MSLGNKFSAPARPVPARTHILRLAYLPGGGEDVRLQGYSNWSSPKPFLWVDVAPHSTLVSVSSFSSTSYTMTAREGLLFIVTFLNRASTRELDALATLGIAHCLLFHSAVERNVLVPYCYDVAVFRHLPDHDGYQFATARDHVYS